MNNPNAIRYSYVDGMEIKFMEPAPRVIYWKDTHPENRMFACGSMLLASPEMARRILENEEKP